MFKHRPEYRPMTTSRIWVVQNLNKISSPSFASEIGEVWVFSNTHNRSNKFCHLVYRSQIWKDLKLLWLKTRDFTPRCVFGVSLITNHVWGFKCHLPPPKKTNFWVPKWDVQAKSTKQLKIVPGITLKLFSKLIICDWHRRRVGVLCLSMRHLRCQG